MVQTATPFPTLGLLLGVPSPSPLASLRISLFLHWATAKIACPLVWEAFPAPYHQEWLPPLTSHSGHWTNICHLCVPCLLPYKTGDPQRAGGCVQIPGTDTASGGWLKAHISTNKPCLSCHLVSSYEMGSVPGVWHKAPYSSLTTAL